MDDELIFEKIKILDEEIERLGFTGQLLRMSEYSDEPRMFRFGTPLGSIKKFSDGRDVETTASGFSFESPYLALLKCQMEAIERFSTMCYREKTLIYSSFNKLTQNALDPCIYNSDEKLRDDKVGWTEGYDLMTGEKILLPAQTIYYNYNHKNHEPHLTVHISTGAACGFDKQSTLLRGIYEVIERDAFMTIYLPKIRAPRIDLSSVKSKGIRGLIKKFEKNNLELMVFNITNDLEIPSFLGVIIDRTGLGPSISLGLKSSLHQEEAILGCIQESLQIRIWMRNEMVRAKKNDFPIKPDKITTIKERGLFWLGPGMLKHLDFLLNQKPGPIIFKKADKKPKEELNFVKKLLLKKNLKVLYKDITPSNFKKFGCVVYKVIIPKLQPLYFRENSPEIRKERIKQVAEYFKKERYTLNKIPHPLL